LALLGEGFVIFIGSGFDFLVREIGIAAVWEGGTAAGPATLLFFILT
jgi:hypothetical protein